MPKRIQLRVPENDESGDPLKIFAAKLGDLYVEYVNRAYFVGTDDTRDLALQLAASELQHLRTPNARPALTRRAMTAGLSRTVWDRDDWTCRHCGGHAQLTVDHIVPVSKGGTDDLDNLQTLCWSCNSKKGAN